MYLIFKENVLKFIMLKGDYKSTSTHPPSPTPKMKEVYRINVLKGSVYIPSHHGPGHFSYVLMRFSKNIEICPQENNKIWYWHIICTSLLVTNSIGLIPSHHGPGHFSYVLMRFLKNIEICPQENNKIWYW